MLVDDAPRNEAVLASCGYDVRAASNYGCELTEPPVVSVDDNLGQRQVNTPSQNREHAYEPISLKGKPFRALSRLREKLNIHF